MKTLNDLHTKIMKVSQKYSKKGFAFAECLEFSNPELLNELKNEYKNINLSTCSKTELLNVHFICLPTSTKKEKLINKIDNYMNTLLRL